MAAAVPAKLKQLDIGRFAQRAAQIEKVKPAIAYWCNYWILHQILANRLQQADAECTTYTMNLMDHVEQVKAQYASDDAIVDDVAGQAYVEQFGLETFQRADNAVQGNKASKQTADTFLASATFLELLGIWGPPSPEAASKIKYAKFHALRIVKAVKAGEDPNLSNPPPVESDPADKAADITLDPNDPEVQRITLATEHHPGLATSTAADAAASHVHSTPLDLDTASSTDHARPPGGPVSGQSAFPDQSEKSRQNSAGGGYFPESASLDETMAPSTKQPPPQKPVGDDPSNSPEAFYNGKALPSTQRETASQTPPVPPSTTHVASETDLPSSSPVKQPVPAQPAITADDTAVADAQKHARWAISALNFDDVSTAVKELRLALSQLGAS